MKVVLFVLTFLFSLSSVLSAKSKVGITIVQKGEEGCIGADDGDIISFRHNGYFIDGATGQKTGHFDSSGPDTPLRLTLGKSLIQGLSLGLKGMCEGEVRQIVIPPGLAFDDKRRFPNGPPNDIPEGKVVLYEVEMEQVIKKGSVEASIYPVFWSLTPSLAGVMSFLFFSGIIGYLVYNHITKPTTAPKPISKSKEKN